MRFANINKNIELLEIGFLNKEIYWTLNSAVRQRSVGEMLKAQIDANVEDPAKAGAEKLEIKDTKYH